MSPPSWRSAGASPEGRLGASISLTTEQGLCGMLGERMTDPFFSHRDPLRRRFWSCLPSLTSVSPVPMVNSPCSRRKGQHPGDTQVPLNSDPWVTPAFQTSLSLRRPGASHKLRFPSCRPSGRGTPLLPSTHTSAPRCPPLTGSAPS